MAFDTSSASSPVSQPSMAESETDVRSRFRMRVMPGNTLDTAPQPDMKDPMLSSVPVAEISRRVLIGSMVGVLILGITSGSAAAYLWSQQGGTAADVQQTASEKEVANAVKVGAVFGVPDEKTFRDDTEGVLIIGGIDGEGSHTLLRAGGVTQNVYLTSSVVDLDQFDGARVRIWGETFKGQKAGWLMDVGRVEVKELSAKKPEWYEQQQAKNAPKQDSE